MRSAAQKKVAALEVVKWKLCRAVMAALEVVKAMTLVALDLILG